MVVNKYTVAPTLMRVTSHTCFCLWRGMTMYRLLHPFADMSLTQFVGSLVSIDCGESLGTYQGEVSAVDTETQTLSISKAYRNGIQCTIPLITLKWVALGSFHSICTLYITMRLWGLCLKRTKELHKELPVINSITGEALLEALRNVLWDAFSELKVESSVFSLVIESSWSVQIVISIPIFSLFQGYEMPVAWFWVTCSLLFTLQRCWYTGFTNIKTSQWSDAQTNFETKQQKCKTRKRSRGSS